MEFPVRRIIAQGQGRAFGLGDVTELDLELQRKAFRVRAGQNLEFAVLRFSVEVVANQASERADVLLADCCSRTMAHKSHPVVGLGLGVIGLTSAFGDSQRVVGLGVVVAGVIRGRRRRGRQAFFIIIVVLIPNVRNPLLILLRLSFLLRTRLPFISCPTDSDAFFSSGGSLWSRWI